MMIARETVESFLARGGVIQQCPPSWECPARDEDHVFKGTWTTPLARARTSERHASTHEHPQSRGPMSEEHRRKVSDTLKRRWAARKAAGTARRPMSQAHKDAISKGKRGKPMEGWSPEAKARASARMKGNQRRKGKPHSPETLAKIRASCQRAADKRWGRETGDMSGTDAASPQGQNPSIP